MSLCQVPSTNWLRNMRGLQPTHGLPMPATAWPEVWRLISFCRPRRYSESRFDGVPLRSRIAAGTRCLTCSPLAYSSRTEGKDIPASSAGAPHIRQRLAQSAWHTATHLKPKVERHYQVETRKSSGEQV